MRFITRRIPPSASASASSCAVWSATDLAKAEAAPAELAEWLAENLPEGLTVFALPAHHRRRLLRTSNPIERAIQQELKRRTVKDRVFPDEHSLERLVIAVLVEIDEKRAVGTKACIKWECQDD